MDESELQSHPFTPHPDKRLYQTKKKVLHILLSMSPCVVLASNAQLIVPSESSNGPSFQDRPKCRVYFSHTVFILSSLSWGSFRGILVVFLNKRDPEMYLFSQSAAVFSSFPLFFLQFFFLFVPSSLSLFRLFFLFAFFCFSFLFPLVFSFVFTFFFLSWYQA